MGSLSNNKKNYNNLIRKVEDMMKFKGLESGLTLDLKEIEEKVRKDLLFWGD